MLRAILLVAVSAYIGVLIGILLSTILGVLL